jgi:hypothetical protein
MQKLWLVLILVFISSCGRDLKYDRYNIIGDEVKLKWDHLSTDPLNTTYTYPELNSSFTKDFWQHMQYVYGTKIVDKNTSKSMSFIGCFLSMFGILDKEIFLNEYATTINKTIYLPFIVGNTSDEKELFNEVLLCVHEHQHVVQYIKLKNKYSAGYIFNHKKRAYFETEAYTTSLEIYYWFFKESIDTQYLANKLSNYNCSKKDIANSKNKLDENLKLIESGKIISESGKTAIFWLEKNAKNLQKEKEQK